MPHGENAQRSERVFRALLAVLAIIAAALLWAFSNNQQVGDSLGIAYYIKVGRDVSNPHHLLYGPIIYVLHRAANLVVEVDVISIGQLHNIFWSVVSILSLSWLVRFYSRSVALALAAGVVLLVSHQFWQYSTQIEVYVPALGCLALLSVLVVRYADSAIPRWLPWVTGLLLMLSICYHQMGVLFLIPLAVLFYLQWGRAGALVITKVAVGTGLVTIAAYVTVYLIMYSPAVSIGGFAKYCVHYAYSNPDWGTFEHFTKKEEVSRIFHNISGSFLAQYWAGKVPVWLCAIVITAVYVWNVVAAWRRRIGYTLRVVLLLWLGVYFLFLLWWTPGYEFFVMLVWPILLLVLFLLLDIVSLLKQPTWAAALVVGTFIAILTFTNYQAFAYYHNNHDEGYNKATELMGYNKDGCWVIANFNVMLNLTYFYGFHDMLESDGLATDYYYRDSIPSITQFKDMDCVLTEMVYYNPWYGPMGETGFTQPQQWLLLNANLFKFETDSLGRLIAAAPFEVFSSPDKVPFMKVDRTQTIPIAGYAAFYAKLDSLVTIHGQEKDISYLMWYEQNKDLMP